MRKRSHRSYCLQRVLCSLVLLPVFVLPLPALAQSQEDQLESAMRSENARRMRPAENTGPDFIMMQRRENSSRIAAPDRQARSLSLETQTSMQLSLPPMELGSCQAAVSLGYYQRNTLARVELEVRHAGCPEVVGTVDIVARITDAGGEAHSLVFEEAWQLVDGRPLTFAEDYEIGPDVDLRAVSARNIRCACMDRPQEE